LLAIACFRWFRQSNGRNTQIRGRITLKGVELIHEKLRST
jgi:hypothetical protein